MSRLTHFGHFAVPHRRIPVNTASPARLARHDPSSQYLEGEVVVDVRMEGEGGRSSGEKREDRDQQAASGTPATFDQEGLAALRGSMARKQAIGTTPTDALERALIVVVDRLAAARAGFVEPHASGLLRIRTFFGLHAPFFGLLGRRPLVDRSKRADTI